MCQQLYTCHINITSHTTVRIEKRDPENKILGELYGRFTYIDNAKNRIHELHQAARMGCLVESEMKELGTLLFDTLFDAELRSDFLNLYEQIRHEGKDTLLRLELDIDERQLPEVASLPWECMCVPPTADYGATWLGTAPDLIFTRRRAHWRTPPPIQLAANEHLRIALVVSTPDELGPVEYKKIWEELCALSSTQMERLELLDLVTSATRSKIDAILEQKPHIFHFIGHARLKDELLHERGQIALTDEIRSYKAQWFGAELFSELFTRYRPSVVLLQACEGAAISASEAFVGVASQVVQQNIPVVISMQYKISNVTGQRFALKFYERLAKNDPVDKAVQEGRRHVSLGPLGYTTSDFVSPVLFSCINDGHLFLPEDPDQIMAEPTERLTEMDNERGKHHHSIQPMQPTSRIIINAKKKGIAINTMHGNIYQYDNSPSGSDDEEQKKL